MGRSRWAALYLLCGGALMIVLDATIVNVALPAIQDDLGFSQAGLAWVVNAYLIAFGGLLLLAGRLGDLIGRRRMFLCGLVVFTGASALCGIAGSQAMLIAARFLQGAGGAMTMAVVLGMIVAMFPEPREQARAIGVYAFVASAGGAVGLLAGGVLTELSWHWIFAINIPIGIAIGIGALRVLHNDKGAGLTDGTDVPGAVLITGALMLGVFTIVKPAAELGWTAGRTLLLGVLALALLAAFVGWEARTRHPLMPLRIFRSRNVSGANLIQVVTVAGMFGMFFLGTLYMEKVLGFAPLRIGLAFLPVTVIMGTLSVRYSERLVMRFGARTTLIPGLLLVLIGLGLFTQAPVAGNYWVHVFPVMVLFGVGAGLAFPALMNLAMSGVPAKDAGMASGLANTTMQVGGALGLAVLATLSGSRTKDQLAAGVPQPEALTSGFHLAFAVGAGLVAVALVVAIAVLRKPADDPDAELDGLEREVTAVHIL
ncbi:MFS transporter [Nocardia terpenica]|uniref:MFS transporter n=1 Tax=Nocardia terpenica TaxID=455432 RepID=UPI0018937784|nr:MFS transporter [Nocardia terpenica]MBF6066002.1 MFS transporter [Nocardia terpenica]MBF6109071.1 MFS transporter [Nocardia terpenica]MBF6116246.1 MFS transporter [Nocardia terpenica]MBF6123247.1 MFS transporter [Nocardia terpenica]MBF6156570.1 MFS transporter [Nocardia terpenica]